MPGLSSGGIFLTYRREGAAPYARLLKDELRERFPAPRVFMDLDSIEVGTDFAEAINKAVNSCVVQVALLNALEFSYGRYDHDAGRLFDHIQRERNASPNRSPTIGTG